MDGNIMRFGTIGSCQSAATSEIALLVTSLTHVSGAITKLSIPLPFTVCRVFWSLLLNVWLNIEPYNQCKKISPWLSTALFSNVNIVHKCSEVITRTNLAQWP